jgi:methyl-accepting chemotaxis protein
MPDRPHYKRSNYFIKKGFQVNFSIRFLLLIVIEAILLGCLFWFISHNTLTTGYVGSQLRIENTSSYFFPAMTVTGLIVVVIVGIIGIIGLVFISHKIAGPLYRFEASLKAISNGDLTHRTRTREKDQLKDLADSLNNFTSVIDGKVADVKQDVQDAVNQLTELKDRLSSPDKLDPASIEHSIQDISGRLSNLRSKLEQFKTSNDNDSMDREV